MDKKLHTASQFKTDLEALGIRQGDTVFFMTKNIQE